MINYAREPCSSSSSSSMHICTMKQLLLSKYLQFLPCPSCRTLRPQTLTPGLRWVLMSSGRTRMAGTRVIMTHVVSHPWKCVQVHIPASALGGSVTPFITEIKQGDKGDPGRQRPHKGEDSTKPPCFLSRWLQCKSQEVRLGLIQGIAKGSSTEQRVCQALS